jgi:hypothetical protein
LQELYGDDFQMIFCHSQQATKDQWEAFRLAAEVARQQRHVDRGAAGPGGGNTIPKCALVGVDGTVLMTGNPLEFGKKLDEAIAAEIKKAKDPPAGTPKSSPRLGHLRQG